MQCYKSSFLESLITLIVESYLDLDRESNSIQKILTNKLEGKHVNSIGWE